MNFRAHQPALSLDGAWRFARDRRPHDGIVDSDTLERAGLAVHRALVPGCVELDLMAIDALPDPFVASNAVAARALESDWFWYQRRFTIAEPEPGDAEPILVFEGLDCCADVFLNGERIADVDNMLVEHRIPVAGKLWQGDNELLIRFRPALAEARRYPYPPLLLAGPGRQESLHLRKAAHMFGWDIFPRLVSAGIWRPVSLRFVPRTRLETAFLETQRVADDGSSARLALHWSGSGPRFAGGGHLTVEVEGQCGQSGFAARAPALFVSGHLAFTVADPLLWWPRGRGEASLYDVTVTLREGDEVLDSLRFTHGIRTIELDRTSVTDSDGAGEFCFRVNGEKLFALGANWVPVDALTGRQAGRIADAVELADEVGCNMLRVWGGGVYETDAFYDLCDRKGILIWQDFMMGCAVYPQDDAFRARLRDEARNVVRRLRQHACLALWAGDNECDQAWSWGGRRQDPNDNVLTRIDLPAVLREEDPTRPYLPSSPFIDREAFVAGERRLPENHLWGPRNYYKSDYYLDAPCHFVSEIGYHGCPEPASLRRFLSPERLWPWQDNPEWVLHSTSPMPGIDLYDYRVELMATQIRALFGTVPDNLDDYAFASQSVQAEAMKFFVERFRLGKWRRTGILWWNLLDGWPQLSDAVVDYYFVRKRAFHFLRCAHQPLLVALAEPDGDRQTLFACLDSRENTPLRFTVRDAATEETIHAGAAIAVGDAVTNLGAIPYDPDTQRLYRIEWEAGDLSGASHYLAGKPPFDLATYRRWLAAARLQ